MTIPTSGLFAMLAPRKDEILAAAVAQAKMSGAQPTLDIVKTAAMNVARNIGETMLKPLCKAKLDAAVMMAGFTCGERPAGLPADDPIFSAWSDSFDQSIMDTLGEDLCAAAGQDFLGEYMTGSEIDEEGVRVAAAGAMARNVVQANILARSPGQVLAEIGIVADDLAGAAGDKTGIGAAIADAAPLITESTARGHVEQLVGRYVIQLGMERFQPLALEELLKGAFDDDPFLPLEFINRLGGSQSDAPYFAAYYKAAGQEAVQNTAQAAMMAALTGQIVEMPKDAPKPKKGRGKKGETADLPPAVSPPPPPVVSTSAPQAGSNRAAGDDDVSEVIRLMLEHGGDGQAELGELVGKSRAHINNVKAGKSSVSVNAAQRKALSTRLGLRIEGLQAALARLT